MSKRGSEHRKRRRAALFQQQGGRCYWCNCQMVLLSAAQAKTAKRLPKNTATIDHLRDRFHPGRREPAHGQQRLVAACWLCNHKRGQASVAAQPKHVIWDHAGHLERMMAAE